MKTTVIDTNQAVKDHLSSLAKAEEYSMVIWYPCESCPSQKFKDFMSEYIPQDNLCYLVSFKTKKEYEDTKVLAQQLAKEEGIEIDFYNKKRKEK